MVHGQCGCQGQAGGSTALKLVTAVGLVGRRPYLVRGRRGASGPLWEPSELVREPLWEGGDPVGTALWEASERGLRARRRGKEFAGLSPQRGWVHSPSRWRTNRASPPTTDGSGQPSHNRRKRPALPQQTEGSSPPTTEGPRLSLSQQTAGSSPAPIEGTTPARVSRGSEPGIA